MESLEILWELNAAHELVSGDWQCQQVQGGVRTSESANLVQSSCTKSRERE